MLGPTELHGYIRQVGDRGERGVLSRIGLVALPTANDEASWKIDAEEFYGLSAIGKTLSLGFFTWVSLTSGTEAAWSAEQKADLVAYAREGLTDG